MAKAKRVKGINCNASVADNARRIIETRLREMLSFGPYVDNPENTTQIHDLRIAAKRLRYTLELFRFAFPPGLDKLINEVKEIQEHIGAMRDADVMTTRVVETVSRDAANRALRLVEIASAVERGTIAQRHQRIRSAMTNRATPRDEVAYYTLIAHRADDEAAAYARFIAAWQRMNETDFAHRLRTLVGITPPELPEPELEAAESPSLVIR